MGGDKWVWEAFRNIDKKGLLSKWKEFCEWRVSRQVELAKCYLQPIEQKGVERKFLWWKWEVKESIGVAIERMRCKMYLNNVVPPKTIEAFLDWMVEND